MDKSKAPYNSRGKVLKTLFNQLSDDFHKDAIRTVTKAILNEDGFHHVNTRWLRLFKERDFKYQKLIIDTVINIQFEFVYNSMVNREPEISLDNFGKFIIKPAREYYLDSVASEDFDENYDKLRKETKQIMLNSYKKKPKSSSYTIILKEWKN